MSEISLRPARSTDAGKLGDMITQAVAARDWKPVLWSAAQDIAHAGMLIDRGWVTVAEDHDHQVLGFLAREGEMVHSLFVSSTAQGKGVGTALLNSAKACCGRLELWTFEKNTGAQRLYRREGFHEVERTEGSDNEERLPDIRFEWRGEPAAKPLKRKAGTAQSEKAANPPAPPAQSPTQAPSQAPSQAPAQTSAQAQISSQKVTP